MHTGSRVKPYQVLLQKGFGQVHKPRALLLRCWGLGQPVDPEDVHQVGLAAFYDHGAGAADASHRLLRIQLTLERATHACRMFGRTLQALARCMLSLCSCRGGVSRQRLHGIIRVRGLSAYHARTCLVPRVQQAWMGAGGRVGGGVRHLDNRDAELVQILLQRGFGDTSDGRPHLARHKLYDSKHNHGA
jgi:hypothetical protein